jgi:hypothetical protein
VDTVLPHWQCLCCSIRRPVADASGRKDRKDLHEVSIAVLTYSVILEVLLGALLYVGFCSKFLLSCSPTILRRDAGRPAEIVALIVVAQPLNSLVFAADGILLGAFEFPYQAKSMVRSAIVASFSVWVLQSTDQGADFCFMSGPH